MQGYRITLWLLCVTKVFGCDVGRFQFADSCYDFVQAEDNLTWMEALKVCKDSGGSLVSFETDSEQDAVRGYRYARYNTNREKFYIGLYNQGVSPMWVSNAYLSSNRWSPKSAPHGESCEGTVLDVTDNNWLRVMCYIRYEHIGYICEYPYERPPTIKPTGISTITPINAVSTVEGTQQTNDLTVLCPRDRFVYGNSCYEFVEDLNTNNWTYAVMTCASKGGQLVSMETEEENDAIMNTLKQTTFLYKELFIGLRRPRDGVNATWLSGAPLKYDRHGENNSNFRCTTIFAFQSLWFARPCDPGLPVASGYICEYSRETTGMPSADVTVLMTSGRHESTNVTTVRRLMDGDGSNLKIGVLISVIIVLLILIAVAIIYKWRSRKVGKHPINKSSGEITNTAFTADVNEGLTQQGVVMPVYMQLETPDIIRETPNTVGSIRLEINIQPSYESVNDGGSYYELRRFKSKEAEDPIAKERFISRNLSRAKTVLRMSGRKRFEDQNQGKTDIKNNRHKSCKPHYIAGQERALYAQSNLGFSQNTCTLPNQGNCSVANEHFYNKPIYDECGPAQDGEQIYSLPCADTLASKSDNPAEIVDITDHYYSSLTDPTEQSNQVVSSDGVYFVLEKPDDEKPDNNDEFGKEVENEIYEGVQ